MSAQERSDLIETRADMAKSVLDVLLASMENESPPTDGVVNKVVSAAIELLSVTEIVA